jgi:U3 small nucleolar RNA-associated protein 19
MIHRNPYPPYTSSTDNLGNDPFDMSEPNPQLTHAIDSSLWEIETLQSHYHPNVASLARIISEQFTRQQYNLEDFLDYGYASMVESELGKEAKKALVVEWKIPKRILTKPADGASDEEIRNMSLVQKLWDLS